MALDDCSGSSAGTRTSHCPCEQERRLTRKPFAIRYGIAALIGLISVLTGIFLEPTTAAAISLLSGLILMQFILVWSVYRTQDFGWSKWINLLYFVPVAQAIWVIWLLLTPGRPSAESGPIPENAEATAP
jgi:uncharacterized membrane protein YhaH (DUF805 family)